MPDPTLDEQLDLVCAAAAVLSDCGAVGYTVSPRTKAALRVAFQPFATALGDDCDGCLPLADARAILESET